jgi:putative redox protein
MAENPAAPVERPNLTCELTWAGELQFTARSGQAGMLLDSAGRAGPSPMQALAFALAGCMGMDVVHVMERSRVPATAVRVALTGRRANEYPRRFVAIDLHFTIDGQASDDVVTRAIALSRDKYCSVWNSMRQDIPLNVTFTVNRGPVGTS